jgi:hypothetical protein
MLTVSDEELKSFVVNSFGSFKDYYVKFLEKNFELSEEEAKQVVEYFFVEGGVGKPLKYFFDVVRTLRIEVLDEEELNKKKLLDLEFIKKWFCDAEYIGD